MKKKIISIVVMIILIVMVIYLILNGKDIYNDLTKENINVVITQLKMTDTDGGQGYGIKLPSGKLVMIDGGYYQDAVPVEEYIKANGGEVLYWFITHPHFDHVGGLNAILAKEVEGIEIENIYYSGFTPEFFEEEGVGKDLEKLNKATEWMTFEYFKENTDINFVELKRDDVLDIEGIKMTCLHGFDENIVDVNGNSLLLHFNFGKDTFLFTGDATDTTFESMVEHYGENNDLLDVDYIQIPHHGYMAGFSTDYLYRLTTPDVAYLDCSRNEYKNNLVNIQVHLDFLRNLNIPIVKRFEGDNILRIE